jgi:hypothetical protein
VEPPAARADGDIGTRRVPGTLGILWCARLPGAALTDAVYAGTPEHLQDEIDDAEAQARSNRKHLHHRPVPDTTY